MRCAFKLAICLACVSCSGAVGVLLYAVGFGHMDD